jgi:hypothetical protein
MTSARHTVLSKIFECDDIIKYILSYDDFYQNLYEKLEEKLNELDCDVSDFNPLGCLGISYYTDTEPIMYFGKYKGVQIRKLPIDYLQWMIDKNVKLSRSLTREIWLDRYIRKMIELKKIDAKMKEIKNSFM